TPRIQTAAFDTLQLSRINRLKIHDLPPFETGIHGAACGWTVQQVRGAKLFAVPRQPGKRCRVLSRRRGVFESTQVNLDGDCVGGLPRSPPTRDRKGAHVRPRPDCQGEGRWGQESATAWAG